MSGSRALVVRRFYGKHRTAFTTAMYTSFFGAMAYRLIRPSATPKLSRSKRKRVAVNADFIRQLLALFKILVPKGIHSREFWLLFLESAFLVFRSALSLYVAGLDGQITAYLVQGDGKAFLRSVAWWMVVGVPASLTNSMLHYLQQILSLRFRARLTAQMLSKYLPTDESPGSDKSVYYWLNSGNRINGPEQIMTADIARLSSSLSALYANLAKPILDMSLYTWQLSRNIGSDNVFMIGLAVQLSARALKLAAPPFGEYVAEEAALEGDFRAKHTRLVDYSEEVALYNGHEVEKLVVNRSFYSLFMHAKRTLRHRLQYHFFEDFVIKYYWGALGLVLCAIPVFFDKRNARRGSYVQSYVTNRRLLLFCSDAFGRVVESGKDISSLAGYVSRVSNYFSVVTDLATSSNDTTVSDGVVEVGDHIAFEHVSVMTPTDEVLIKDLTFSVSQGQNVLIVGPNGSGKSSLFRLLGGLWPLRGGGKLVRPPQREMFYIPQRPYLSRGSLRQQVIYPTTEEDNVASDEELMEILRILQIEDCVEQVGGWDAEREWKEDLSMGMQQKIAAARLFYHKPRFAILDECTSSITIDIEQIIYTHAQVLGITLLTVSHRASLWKYHSKILQLDGYGGYIFTDLDAESRLRLEEEKLALDMKLRQVPEIREKLKTLTA